MTTTTYPLLARPPLPTGVEFLGAVAVSGAAVTNMTVSGLSLSADQEYYIEFEIYNPTGSTASLYLFYNSDSTLANYFGQSTVFTTTATAARTSTPLIGAVVTVASINGVGWVKTNPQAQVRARVFTESAYSSAMDTRYASTVWVLARRNVTSLTINSSVASAIGVGSAMRVFRIKR